MSKRYKTQNTTPLVAFGETKLPFDRPIAVYYRQSTDAQIGNISTSMQTIDMADYLIRLGWQRDKIIMIDMDAGVSGSTKIDERQGMSALLGLITKGEIGAVACQDEDRLFRDVTQIQVNIFMEACRKAKVLVITPTMVYDFSNEFMGQFHARQFRFKSDMAAEYITSVIRGKLHKAKQKLIMEGKWGGAGVPPGFMVDIRKTLPDGIPNPNWRRYVPFEPYAQVVNAYFRMFLAHAGNIRATIREIQTMGPYYPDPAICVPPPGFKVHYKIYRYENGFCPGKTGLVELLTNAAYLGHWVTNDAVIKWNNHPAIVPKDIFTRAFNYLSEVTLDGQPNAHHSHLQDHARPSREETRAQERPLCAGMIRAKFQGKWCKVGTSWVGPSNHYSYVLLSPGVLSEYVWGKKASYVDDAIIDVVRKKLHSTFDSNVWQKTLASHHQIYADARRLKMSQLASFERVMENLIGNLETLENKDMIRAAEKRYSEAQAEQKRLLSEINNLDDEAQVLAQVSNLQETYQLALNNWSNTNRNEKRVILQAFIQDIDAAPINGHGLQLVIHWKDESADEIILPRQATTGTHWLPKDTDRLLYLIDNGCSQIEIAREFPKRTWAMIRQKVWETRGTANLHPRPKPIKDYETYEDYMLHIKDISQVVSMGFEGRRGRECHGVPARFRRGGEYSRRRQGLRG